MKRSGLDVGVHLLDGDSVEVQGIKLFVQEAVNEALKLESALARLTTTHRVAVLHYAPIRETVEGKPLEIFPCLGSSRLEESLTRFEVTAAFHGHAHKGAPEGRTSTGIPVYNVSLTVLKHHYPDKAPFRLFEIPRDAAPATDDQLGERRVQGRRAEDQREAARAS